MVGFVSCGELLRGSCVRPLQPHPAAHPILDPDLPMKRAPAAAPALTALPNIGKEVAALLTTAGIATADDLRRAGAVAAALRIREVRPQDPPCRSLLAGLEGAIRGIRWHDIPGLEREAQWQEYEALAARETSSAALRRSASSRTRNRRG